MRAGLVLVLLMCWEAAGQERCPPIVGEAECPLNHFCKDKGCYASLLQLQPSSFCSNVDCRLGTACRFGMCYPVESLKCNRHVLVGTDKAHSVITTCGRNGKCINGRCQLDRCMGVYCGEGEMCRDGACIQVAGSFCLGHADCGPRLDCIANRCSLRAFPPLCNCSPMEICRNGFCIPNSRCSTVRCPPGLFCLHGSCVPAVGQACGLDVCRGGTACVNGVCQIDPCLGKCEGEQDCRQGQCRLLLGLPCIGECPFPYDCLNGRCVKNGCRGRLCPLEHACEDGRCVKIAERFCISAMRDCAYGYTCERNRCVETFTAALIGDRSIGSSDN